MSGQEAKTQERGGYVGAVLELPFPRPAKPVCIIKQSVPEGSLEIEFHPDGRLLAALRRPGETEPALRASSCPLLTLTPARVILSINWIPPNSMDIHINGNLLGSAEKPEDCPREHWLAGGAPSGGHTDFTQKNIAARKKRRETLAGIRPRIGKIPGGKERHFKALRAEVRQLGDLLGLVRGGSTDHILGISNRLRMTISMGKPLATLQLCAAHVDASLMVYTSARPELPFPLKLPVDRFEFNLSAEPTAMLSNGVDIDVWLGLPGAQTEQAHDVKAVVSGLRNADVFPPRTEGAHTINVRGGIQEDHPRN